MPTPKAPKSDPVREEPEEARTSGGVLAEGELPQEFELVVVDSYGDREVKRIWNLTFGFALKDAAREIYFDIAEEVKRDMLAELPYPRFKAKIRNTKNDVYEIEIKGNHLTRVLHVKKTKAVYYHGGIEVESTEGYPIYIPLAAVYVRREKVTYYELGRNTVAIDTIKEELEKMLMGEQ